MILVQYYDLREISREGGDTRWTLAAVSTRGDLLFEITDTPQLFAVDDQTGDLFFRHPNHEAEDHWIVGQLRTGVLPDAAR